MRDGVRRAPPTASRSTWGETPHSMGSKLTDDRRRPDYATLAGDCTAAPGEFRPAAGRGFSDRSSVVHRTLSGCFGPQDAAFLYSDTDAAPLNVGSVGIFEGEIPFDTFVESVASKLHLVPRYRQRVVSPPFNVGRPTWEYDPNFDIRRHIHRVRIEQPGTDSQLADLAAKLYAGRLDREKPLWELYLVEGLEGGRTGMIAKTHHCLVDGVSGIELLMVTLDVSQNPAPPPPPSGPYNPPALPNPLSLLFDALWGRAPGGGERRARCRRLPLPSMARSPESESWPAPRSRSRRCATSARPAAGP